RKRVHLATTGYVDSQLRGANRSSGRCHVLIARSCMIKLQHWDAAISRFIASMNPSYQMGSLQRFKRRATP
ncbi:hypothetical protein KXX51_007829, partial [Aspergillus fumigatus]